MATIYIRDLIIDAKHGVHAHEKQTAQRFYVSVEIDLDTSLAGQTDNVDDTLDWSGLRATIIDTVQNNAFNLMERLVHEVATKLLAYPQANTVIVSIDKLDAFKTGIPGIKLTLNRA